MKRSLIALVALAVVSLVPMVAGCEDLGGSADTSGATAPTVASQPGTTVTTAEQMPWEGNEADDGALFKVTCDGGETWGFIDETGTIVVQPQFVEVGPFAEGLAGVSPDGETVGYIDSTGTMVIQPQFTDALSFSDGLAMVSYDGEETWD